MIAIIPARGGSKGVPRKNIKMLMGKPLIYYTIKAALESEYIDKVVVTTDDFEISEISKSFGAEVPFLRPEILSTDTAKAIDVYLYTVEKLTYFYHEKIDDFIVLLPTSPLRSSSDIDNAIKIYCEKKAESVISVVSSKEPPNWFKKIDSDGLLKDYFSSTDNSINRQEAEETYLPNGAIYVFNYNALKVNQNYYNKKTYPYIMSPESSWDIDTELDFKIVEFLIKEHGCVPETNL